MNKRRPRGSAFLTGATPRSGAARGCGNALLGAERPPGRRPRCAGTGDRGQFRRARAQAPAAQAVRARGARGGQVEDAGRAGECPRDRPARRRPGRSSRRAPQSPLPAAPPSPPSASEPDPQPPPQPPPRARWLLELQ